MVVLVLAVRLDERLLLDELESQRLNATYKYQIPLYKKREKSNPLTP